MVVNLAVDSENDLSVVTNKRLGASVCIINELSCAEKELGMTHEPTPTIARRSWARILRWPTKQPDQSGPRCLSLFESAMNLARSLTGFSRPWTARMPHMLPASQNCENDEDDWNNLIRNE